MPAESLGDRPDVRPGADVQLEPHGGSRIRDDVERVDLRAPQRHLHGDAAPGQLVCALTADPDGRGGRDRQLDLTAEAPECGVELVPRGRRVRLAPLALRVAGGGRRRQVDVGDVALVQPDEAWSQSSCRTGQQNEQPGRGRVERAGVTRPRAGPPPQRGDERERRRPGRLVGEHHADRFQSPLQAPTPASELQPEPAVTRTNSRCRKSVISAIDSSDENPAAWR